MLLLKRARVVAGAKSKLDALRKLMKKYKDAPVKGGEYQVEAVLKDWKRKQKKAMDQKKHEAAKAPANQNEKKERTSSLGKSK